MRGTPLPHSRQSSAGRSNGWREATSNGTTHVGRRCGCVVCARKWAQAAGAPHQSPTRRRHKLQMLAVSVIATRQACDKVRDTNRETSNHPMQQQKLTSSNHHPRVSVLPWKCCLSGRLHGTLCATRDHPHPSLTRIAYPRAVPPPAASASLALGHEPWCGGSSEILVEHRVHAVRAIIAAQHRGM